MRSKRDQCLETWWCASKRTVTSQVAATGKPLATGGACKGLGQAGAASGRAALGNALRVLGLLQGMHLVGVAIVLGGVVAMLDHRHLVRERGR